MRPRSAIGFPRANSILARSPWRLHHQRPEIRLQSDLSPSPAVPERVAGGVQIQPVRRRIQVTGTANVPVIYANFVALNLGDWDFQFTFCLLRPTESTDEYIPAKAQVQVILSPQQFKALTQLMTRNLEAFESRFGLASEKAVRSD